MWYTVIPVTIGTVVTLPEDVDVDTLVGIGSWCMFPVEKSGILHYRNTFYNHAYFNVFLLWKERVIKYQKRTL